MSGGSTGSNSKFKVELQQKRRERERARTNNCGYGWDRRTSHTLPPTRCNKWRLSLGRAVSLWPFEEGRVIYCTFAQTEKKRVATSRHLWLFETDIKRQSGKVEKEQNGTDLSTAHVDYAAHSHDSMSNTSALSCPRISSWLVTRWKQGFQG